METAYFLSIFVCELLRGRGGLVVRSRSTSQPEVPALKPISTEDPPCTSACCTLNVLPLAWCGSLTEGDQFKCRPHHPTAIQNDEVPSQNSPHVASKWDVNILN
ncbi:hypothetical protein AVEN_132941-1 [Araneus ventricosus]|uniref:Uncharacterized protein n=1 Tax=Araneus ventricosus TaxID=182803 RepID=A0A4Y2KNP0_ARAVE|nr:hypothetical protein AVEN_132941-1 [Araneus ventricosus]